MQFVIAFIIRVALFAVIFFAMALVAADSNFYHWPLWYRAIFLVFFVIDTMAGIYRQDVNARRKRIEKMKSQELYSEFKKQGIIQ